MKYSCKDQETIIEIKHLEENILKIWWDLPDRYNGYVLRYGKENDKELRRLDRKFARYINEVCTGSKESAAEFEFEEYLRHFMEKVLNISSRSLEIIFKNNYLKISREFMERARETDGSLTMANIFQGLRNVWIMQLMQIHFHLKPVLTDSVFAYSMLYPLTDNLLDDSSLKKEEKRDFNRRFRDKIAGHPVQPRNLREEKIFAMIDLIESQWNRQEYPQVYNSLLLIQSGQNMSLKQQNLSNPFTTDLLGISFFKGGSSVLADAYLIKGDLTPVEERFAYWYGVILQLADDIQDINEDLKNNHSTIMNLQSRIGYIDRLVENLLNMIDYFLSEIFPADSETRVALKEMTRETVQLLIFASIIKNNDFPAYV